MKNTAHKGIVHFLVINRGKDGYLGICKEFGFVEEAKTQEEILKKLKSGATLLLDTVRKNPRFELSLNINPPFKYLILFYLVPLISAVSLLFSKFKGSIQLITHDTSLACYA